MSGPTTAPPLWRRAAAEAIGTGLLVTVVVGSGIMATRTSPGNVGLELLQNSVATMLGLAVIILIVGPVSGAHLNPVVSLADFALGRRNRSGLTAAALAVYIPAQIAGGIGGTILANSMFDLPAVAASHHVRTGHALWLGEITATAGLILLVFTLARIGKGHLGPAAVGAYIGAAYWFTSSTSFANPAVTIARSFTDTFAGIAPASIAGFLLAQLLGAVVGLGLLAILHPTPNSEVPAVRLDTDQTEQLEPSASAAH